MHQGLVRRVRLLCYVNLSDIDGDFRRLSNILKRGGVANILKTSCSITTSSGLDRAIRSGVILLIRRAIVCILVHKLTLPERGNVARPYFHIVEQYIFSELERPHSSHAFNIALSVISGVLI